VAASDDPEKVDPLVRTVLVGTGDLALLTEVDLAEALARGVPPDTSVGELARAICELHPVRPDTSLLEVARLLLSGEVARVQPSAEGDLPPALSIRSGCQ
jgi:CBS domain-containing protein